MLSWTRGGRGDIDPFAQVMEQKPPWTYIPLSEYSAPSAPAAEAAQKGLISLWRRLWSRGAAEIDPVHEISQKASADSFDQLFSSPDWEAGTSNLGALVEEGLAEGRTVQVFVGGPHRCTSEMLRDRGRARRWKVLEAPTPAEILEGRFQPPDFARDETTAVVIPQLAHWFLRHDNGLEVGRGLVEWICSAKQPVFVGCQSWAWCYLNKAINLGTALPEPRVLAPFDGDKLTRWFEGLSPHAGNARQVFREASSGKVVLEPGSSSEGDKAAARNGNRSTLLAHIAARSRGLPEISWGLWRESILRFKKEMVTDVARKTVVENEERTIWVPSWTLLDLPEVPFAPGHLPLFLMHTLLLHAGLPADVLPLLMPFSRAEIQRTLYELQLRRMVELEMDRWRVTAAGYPSVRGSLKNEGYLVDSL